MKKIFFDIHDTGKFFLWVLAAPQILLLFAELLLVLVAPLFNTTAEEFLNMPFIAITLTMMAQIAFLIVLFLYNKKFNLKKAAKINLKIGSRNTILAVLIGSIGFFSIAPLTIWFDKFLVSIGYNVSSIGFEITNVGMLVLAILLLALVPAFVEELIFRGVVFQGLKKYGKWLAILACSGLFVLVHGSLQQVIYPFIISIVLCLFVFKTNSVVSACVVHFVSNALSLLTGYFGFALTLPIWASILLAAAGVGVMLLLTKFGKNTEKPRAAEEIIEEIEKPMPAYNNNSFVFKIALVLAALLFILNIVAGFMPQP